MAENDTTQSMLAEFEHAMRRGGLICLGKSFDDLKEQFDTAFAPVSQLIRGINDIARRYAAQVILELEWIRARSDGCLEGCLVGRRPGLPIREMHIDYDGVYVSIRETDGTFVLTESLDPHEVNGTIMSFAKSCF